MTVGLPENRPNAEVQAAMNAADRVVFFSRLGDQGRFNWHYTGPPCVMSYALDRRCWKADMAASTIMRCG